MTIILNLYGGPGSGKSTLAALTFGHLKVLGVNAELVQEYAKEFAWAGKPITDQWHVYCEQKRREDRLIDAVDAIVTDSPLAIGAFYTSLFTPGLQAAIDEHVVAARLLRHPLTRELDRWVRRETPYNPAGRYETAEQALERDAQQRPYVERLLRYDSGMPEVRSTIEDAAALARQIKEML